MLATERTYRPSGAPRADVQMALCATCGNQISDTTAFCTKCGAARARGPQIKPPRLGMKACRECGHQVSATAKACPNCGARNPALGRRVYAVFSLASLGLAIVVFASVWHACEFGGPSVSESDVASAAPAVSVTADQLARDYEANEVAADERYKQKIVEVSGEVYSIGKDITDTIYVTLQTGNEYAFVKPQLYFSDEYKGETAALHKGDPLTAKCRCDGKFMNVLMKDCVIQASPSASGEANNQ
jgi:RNA polymerase subunit RPABC4/transcription elongation factor Spt4